MTSTKRRTAFLLVLLCLCAGVSRSVVVGSGTAPPPAKIAWGMSTLNLSLYPGTNRTVTVTLRASQALSGESLWLTPSLAAFVAVKPAMLTSTPANTDSTIRLDVAIPSSASLGIYEGTLHVRRGAMTLAQPLPIVLRVATPSADLVPTTESDPSPDRLVANPEGLPYVEGELLVMLLAGTADPEMRIREIAEATEGVILGAIPPLSSYQLHYPGRDWNQLAALRAEVAGLPDVEFVELNWLLGTAQTPMYPNDYDPEPWNDPPSGINWHLEAIRAPYAWAYTTGKTSAEDSRVGGLGVIDSYIDFSHRDLKNNRTIPAGNYDPSYGASFPDGHGTHVAGLACAEGNNGLGVSGSTWRCSLMLYDNTLTTAGVEALMLQAAQNGARVVNGSFAWPGQEQVKASTNCHMYGTKDGPPSVTSPLSPQFFRQVIRRVSLVGYDVLWVFAAGNACRDARNFAPAGAGDEGNVITVAATNIDGHRSWYSNWGDVVAVAAPGGERTVAGPLGMWPIEKKGVRILSTWPADRYELSDGTSVAAPLVAGVANLVRSAHPELTAAQVKACILEGSGQPGRQVPGEPFYLLDAEAAVRCGVFFGVEARLRLAGLDLPFNVPFCVEGEVVNGAVTDQAQLLLHGNVTQGGRTAGAGGAFIGLVRAQSTLTLGDACSFDIDAASSGMSPGPAQLRIDLSQSKPGQETVLRDQALFDVTLKPAPPLPPPGVCLSTCAGQRDSTPCTCFGASPCTGVCHSGSCTDGGGC